ncbi:unnamed protein product [Calypogeia fissa]
MAIANIVTPVLSSCLLPSSSSSSSSPCRNSLTSSSSSICVSTPGLLLKNSGAVTKKFGSSALSRISPTRHTWRQINASYSSVGTDYSSAPIDVAAVVRTQRIVILGGNGFVGSAIAKAAVGQDMEVVSLSRSGRPSGTGSWLEKVTWIAGDVFYTDWDMVLQGATVVVSTLGGFGTNEEMEKLNGDANILAVNAAKDAGVKKFILISVHDYNLPEFALKTGYFTGKRRAEQEVLYKYPETGTILRPAFIYGSRKVNGFEIPLNFIGEPLERLLAQTKTYTRPFAKLPAADLLFAPPVSVEDVAKAALQATKDDDIKGILDIEKIKEAAAALVTE